MPVCETIEAVRIPARVALIRREQTAGLGLTESHLWG